MPQFLVATLGRQEAFLAPTMASARPKDHLKMGKVFLTCSLIITTSFGQTPENNQKNYNSFPKYEIRLILREYSQNFFAVQALITIKNIPEPITSREKIQGKLIHCKK